MRSKYSALLTAINEISESTRQDDIRVKGLGIIYRILTFEFVFALKMLEPILKVSAYSQKSDINLLTAVSLVESLKNTLETMRNTVSNFENNYKRVFYTLSFRYSVETTKLSFSIKNFNCFTILQQYNSIIF